MGRDSSNRMDRAVYRIFALRQQAEAALKPAPHLPRRSRGETEAAEEKKGVILGLLDIIAAGAEESSAQNDPEYLAARSKLLAIRSTLEFGDLSSEKKLKDIADILNRKEQT